MVCEAAASRTDDVETVGISETDANVPGPEREGTDREMEDASEDKGIVWAIDTGIEKGTGMDDPSKEMTLAPVLSVVTMGWIWVPGGISVWMTVIPPRAPWLTRAIVP